MQAKKNYELWINNYELKNGGLAQLARAPALQAGGQRFESVILHFSLKFVKHVNSFHTHKSMNYELRIMNSKTNDLWHIDTSKTVE